MDTRIVYVVTIIDRHFDDVTTVHESEEGAALRVEYLKQPYAERMTEWDIEWRWSEPAKTWYGYDDGPRIRVERKELLP